MWIVVGIIIFLITMYVHKHTYTDIQYDCKTSTYKYYEEDRMPFPIWLLILLFAVSFVPVLNYYTIYNRTYSISSRSM